MDHVVLRGPRGSGLDPRRCEADRLVLAENWSVPHDFTLEVDIRGWKRGCSDGV
jgi:hypothetical protein